MSILKQVFMDNICKLVCVSGHCESRRTDMSRAIVKSSIIDKKRLAKEIGAQKKKKRREEND